MVRDNGGSSYKFFDLDVTYINTVRTIDSIKCRFMSGMVDFPAWEGSESSWIVTDHMEGHCTCGNGTSCTFAAIRRQVKIR